MYNATSSLVQHLNVICEVSQANRPHRLSEATSCFSGSALYSTRSYSSGENCFFFCGLYLPAPRNSVQKHVLHTISGSVGYLINVYLISLLISLVFNFAFIGIWKKLQNNPRKKFLAKFNAPFFIFSYLNRESKIPRNTSCLAKTRN